MRHIIEVLFGVAACGVLAWCLWVLWAVDRDLRALRRDTARPPSAPSSTRLPPLPDAEIDYDYVTLADLRRMSDEQLERGYEHALKRERNRS